MKWLAALLVILLACLPRSTLAQSSDAPDPVEGKLNGELEQLNSKNYRQDGPGLIGQIEREGTRRVSHQLNAGTTYAIVGACDDNCTHVQLSLYDANGKLLIVSPEQAATIIIVGRPDEAGVSEAAD